jgi:hypothetical protein
MQKSPAKPTDDVAAIERALGVFVDLLGETELLRILAETLETRGKQFAAGQIRRAAGRVSQGM